MEAKENEEKRRRRKRREERGERRVEKEGEMEEREELGLSASTRQLLAELELRLSASPGTPLP